MNDGGPDGRLGAGPDTSDDDSGHIAVIGMACRYPGAADVEAFWRNLVDGADTVTREAPRPVPGAGNGSTRQYVPARGQLADPEWFDARYFGYSPREARIISPQHRVFLECAVQALEHAGYDPDRHPGAIGVYGGGTDTSYAQLLRRPECRPSATDLEILLGNATDYLVTRIAYKLGLRGPAVTVQAACATSLVAVHTAVQALLAGDCDLALAGGVAVHVPAKNTPYTEGGILSADGVCRAFDAAAGGTVGGDGAGIVVLKRLSEAVADGDHVHAVLRGSAVNNDGSDRIGFSAPSVGGQAAVIRDAQFVARVDPATVTYVEAHGTATPLGDPIEIEALTRVFRDGTDRRGFCRIGSVKTNIGHTDAAAGVAGLIKAVLALEHGVIPPSLHFAEPNPQIDFAASPFRVATATEDWRAEETPRRAGVSSFGIGGTNAHVVLEEAPEAPPTEPSDPWQLLVLSARTPAAVDAATRRLAAHLRAHPELPLADVVWTLQTGRREHAHRRYAVVGGPEDALRALSDPTGARLVDSGSSPRNRPVTFLFPGTGACVEAGWPIGAQRVFRRALADCHAAAAPHVGAEALKALRRGDGSADPLTADLAVFAEEYALAQLWISWGIRPATVLGKGVGTLTAAAAAGVFALDDAVRLVLDRARLLSRAPGTELADAFAESVREAGPRIPAVRVASGGLLSSDEAAGPAHWSAYLTGQDQLESALSAVLTESPGILLELGVGGTLTSLARRSPGHTDEHVLVADSTGPTAADGAPALLKALGTLWQAGAAISWPEVHDQRRRLRVPLPTYPFERQPYLAESAEERPSPLAEPSAPAEPAGAATPEPAHEIRPREKTLPAVSRLFAEILGLPEVSPDDSFFDLGGDSVIAAQLLVRTRDLFAVDIDPLTLYEADTPTELASLIEKVTADDGSPQTAAP
ncbi:type I polyketide synthase [Streptomyces shenzhenensis]|uniref:type I polyketide synthase n=3 Tax=Streptomyces shenzhenensis TaxID=943815 RepID=UPI00369D316C